MNVEFRSLAELPIGRRLRRDALHALAASARTRKIYPGRLLVEEGASVDGVFIVASGAFAAFMQQFSDFQIVDFLFPGDAASLSLDEKCAYGVYALVSSLVLSIDRRTFACIRQRHPCVERSLFRSTAGKLDNAQDHMTLLGRHQATKRMAWFLSTTNKRERQLDSSLTERIFLPMRRREIANYLGMSSETASRSLSELQHDNIIKVYKHQWILIYDRDKLDERARWDE